MWKVGINHFFFFPEKSKLEIGTFNILVILFITLFINYLYTLLRYFVTKIKY